MMHDFNVFLFKSIIIKINFFYTEQTDKMRVQGASDLIATALVMSFFTLILMTGSKGAAESSKNVIIYNSRCNFIC